MNQSIEKLQNRSEMIVQGLRYLKEVQENLDQAQDRLNYAANNMTNDVQTVSILLPQLNDLYVTLARCTADAFYRLGQLYNEIANELQKEEDPAESIPF